MEGSRSRGTNREFPDDRCQLIHWILKKRLSFWRRSSSRLAGESLLTGDARVESQSRTWKTPENGRRELDVPAMKLLRVGWAFRKKIVLAAFALP